MEIVFFIRTIIFTEYSRPAGRYGRAGGREAIGITYIIYTYIYIYINVCSQLLLNRSSGRYVDHDQDILRFTCCPVPLGYTACLFDWQVFAAMYGTLVQSLIQLQLWACAPTRVFCVKHSTLHQKLEKLGLPTA